MKVINFSLILGGLSLLGGLISCKSNTDKGHNPPPPDPGPTYTDPSELTRLKDLFDGLNTGYNFTLESLNERNARRKLEVFSEYCFYYSYSNTSHTGEGGMFYIENQSTQDFHLEDGQVVIDFHEGPGKVNLVENYAHDDYGDTFAHIPMSELLAVDWTHFFKTDDDNYYTQDKKINRVFNYYTNQNMANWNDSYGGEEYYIDFRKSTTSIKFNEDDTISVTFLPYYKKNVGFTSDGSFLTISKVNNTVNVAISEYLANPTPITKKENYGFNEVDYQATFGNVSIPFSDKFSGYISKVESYKNAAITVYDMCYEDGILEDIQSNIPNNWVYDQQESQYQASQKGHPVYSYHSTSTISQVIDEQTVENEIDVYYSIALVPASNKEPDKTLMPRGFFVGQIYRKLGEEAITDYDAIEAYLDQAFDMSYLPKIERVKSYNCVLRDYTESFSAAFLAQGRYLWSYVQLKIEGVNNATATAIASAFYNDIKNKECYQNVTLDNEYNLNAEPDVSYFTNKGEPVVQIMGSTIKNSNNEITGYQLFIFSHSALED